MPRGTLEHRLLLSFTSVPREMSDDEMKALRHATSPRETENMLRAMSRLVEQQEFESPHEAEAFLNDLLASGKPLPAARAYNDPLSRAQDLADRGFTSPSAEEAIQLARKALEISPDCADAYVLLAERGATRLEQMLAYLRAGVEAGERALGPETFEREAGRFWGILETRPYMRARKDLAEVLSMLGEHDAAIAHFKDLLELNPGDNQGNRYLLADCLLATNRHEELAALLEDYQDDAFSSWSYTRALLLFRLGGETEAADRALDEALEANVFVPAYLFGKRKIRRTPEYVQIGGESEAIDYAYTGIGHWRNTYGALRWLRMRASRSPRRTRGGGLPRK